MDVRFYLDPETGLPHIDGHGVTEVDVDGSSAGLERTGRPPAIHGRPLAEPGVAATSG